MSACVDCGRPVPPPQKVCSMCYGDIDYGRDGYYRAWAEEHDREERQRELDHEAQYEREAADETAAGSPDTKGER